MSAGMTLAESLARQEITDVKWRRFAARSPAHDRHFLLYNRGDRRRWYWPVHTAATGSSP